MLPPMPHFFDVVHFRDRKDLPHIALVSLLIFGIIIGVYLSLQPQIFNKQASESSLVELKFVPEAIQIQAGLEYEAEIIINAKAQRVTATQIDLEYDPAVVTILEAKNEGFVPITLKTEDTFKGTLKLVYGSTVETKATQAGTVATIKFKTLSSKASQISVKGNSQVSVSAIEGNVLTDYPVLKLEAGGVTETTSPEEVRYPDNLLLEKAVHPDPSPFLRDFKEAIEPKPEIKPERVKPGFSGAYIKQLGKDIFIEPIVALNEVIEDKAGEILKPGE